MVAGELIRFDIVANSLMNPITYFMVGRIDLQYIDLFTFPLTLFIKIMLLK